MSALTKRTLLSIQAACSEGRMASRHAGRKVCAAIVAASAIFGTAAAAESGPALSAIRTDLSNSIDLKLTGSIPARCFIAGGREIDFGYVRGGEVARAHFGLDCNLPFDVAVQSLRGGLAHDTSPQGEGPFAGLLGYDLTLTIPTLRPLPEMVRGQYTSRELRGSRTLSSGDAIGAGGGTLEFRMHQPEGAGLLAGQYSETLTLVISPAM